MKDLICVWNGLDQVFQGFRANHFQAGFHSGLKFWRFLGYGFEISAERILMGDRSGESGDYGSCVPELRKFVLELFLSFFGCVSCYPSCCNIRSNMFHKIFFMCNNWSSITGSVHVLFNTLLPLFDLEASHVALTDVKLSLDSKLWLWEKTLTSELGPLFTCLWPRHDHFSDFQERYTEHLSSVNMIFLQSSYVQFCLSLQTEVAL